MTIETIDEVKNEHAVLLLGTKLSVKKSAVQLMRFFSTIMVMKTLGKWIKLLNDAFNSLSPAARSTPLINSIKKPTMASLNDNRLVVVVLGATAAGKSKLAIDVASRFSGEIISVDSMQVYKGLDIVTNKVRTEERNLIKHHLIDFVDPLRRLTVVDFRHRALKIVSFILL